MRKAYEAFILVLQAFCVLLSLGMLAVVVVGVFYRYVLDSSVSWYDEFAGYVLVWLTMYGSVLALARRKHISFETLVEKLPQRAQRGIEIFGLVCILAFALVLVGSGWQLVRQMGAETAISLPSVKAAWVYSVMPITGVLMIVVCVVQLVQAATGARKPITARSAEERAAETREEARPLDQKVPSAEEEVR